MKSKTVGGFLCMFLLVLVPGATVHMNARLGARDKHHSSWMEIARSDEKRKLDCDFKHVCNVWCLM